MKFNLLLASLLLPVASCALAAPFTVSADGQEVTDTKTGLIWRRCAEGMTANAGTCTGTASSFTHEDALTRAGTQAAATGMAWRLPNVKELFSIVDKSRLNPAIDTTAFPATPANEFWSSSPYLGPRADPFSSSPSYVDETGYAWHVKFDSGFIHYVGEGYKYLNGGFRNVLDSRSLAYSVRLVRASQ